MQILEVVVPQKKKFNPYKIYNVSKDSGSKKIPLLSTEIKVINYIKKNCSIMLDAYQQTGKVLYRGIAGARNNIVMTYIRPDRKSIDMDQEDHKFLELIYDRIGLKVNRSNAIFCTSVDHIARDWGTAYVIFVKDGWTGLIFENIKKNYAFHKMQNIAQDYINYTNYNTKELQDDRLNQAVKKINDLHPKQFNTSNNLQEVLNIGYLDILITGENYIGINLNLFENKFSKLLNIKT